MIFLNEFCRRAHGIATAAELKQHNLPTDALLHCGYVRGYGDGSGDGDIYENGQINH